MVSLCLVVVAGAVAFTGRTDPIREFRSDFPGVSYGEPPATGHYERLEGGSATYQDFQRLQAKLLAAPQFRGWKVSKSFYPWSPTIGKNLKSWTIELDRPHSTESVTLYYQNNDLGFDAPFSLTYWRKFNFREKVLSFFTDKPY